MSPRGSIDRPRQAVAALARVVRGVVVGGRWFVLLAWVVAALLAVLLPPPDGASGSGGAGGLLPADSEAVEVQRRSLEQFAVPVLSQTSVVLYDPEGLSPLTRAHGVVWALAQAQATLAEEDPTRSGRILAAVPIPAAGDRAAVTYLYVSPGTSLAESEELAQEYAAHLEQPGVQTYVTGLGPAQLRQVFYLTERLGVFEIGTLVLICLVVALVFRSLVAPLVVLLVVGLGYLVALRLLDVAAAALGFALPDQLRPLTAALFIGVVTDYCVLFFSAFRRQLGTGLRRHEAARRTYAAEGPIVAVAGLTVAGGTAALVVADFTLFRAFGPALALTVLLGVLVSLTLVPALLAILGAGLFLPRRIRPAAAPADGKPIKEPSRLVQLVVDRRGATVATALSVAVLALLAVPVLSMRLDVSFTSGLPGTDPVQEGAQALEDAGVGGVVGPTEVLIEGEGVAEQRAALDRLQQAVAAQPGVAQVLGPAQNPLPEEYGIALSRDGDAARFVVVFEIDPLTAPAIADLNRLQDRLPTLLTEAGVVNATVATTGQTAVAAELVELTREDLWRCLLAALAVELVILALYLRALVAPVVLMACSALSVASALGLSVILFQGVLGDPGLTFYIPFAAAVLLLALGSDYNVFAVGAIWSAAARHPLRRAIALALPASGRAISAAGIILAATFAMVAIIPLGAFRQLAFTMAVGLLLDAFLVRPVLTPALLTLLGRAAGWPGSRIRTSTGPQAPTAPAGSAAPGADGLRPGAVRGDGPRQAIFRTGAGTGQPPGHAPDTAGQGIAGERWDGNDTRSPSPGPPSRKDTTAPLEPPHDHAPSDRTP